jgi:hypothetical protein
VGQSAAVRQPTVANEQGDDPIESLVRVISQYQSSNELSDADVARKLGVPRSTWNNARLGLFRPGLGFAQKAAACQEFRAAAERVLMPAIGTNEAAAS